MSSMPLGVPTQRVFPISGRKLTNRSGPPTKTRFHSQTPSRPTFNHLALASFQIGDELTPVQLARTKAITPRKPRFPASSGVIFSSTRSIPLRRHSPITLDRQTIRALPGRAVASVPPRFWIAPSILEMSMEHAGIAGILQWCMDCRWAAAARSAHPCLVSQTSSWWLAALQHLPLAVRALRIAVLS